MALNLNRPIRQFVSGSSSICAIHAGLPITWAFFPSMQRLGHSLISSKDSGKHLNAISATRFRKAGYAD